MLIAILFLENHNFLALGHFNPNFFTSSIAMSLVKGEKCL